LQYSDPVSNLSPQVVHIAMIDVSVDSGLWMLALSVNRSCPHRKHLGDPASVSAPQAGHTGATPSLATERSRSPQALQ